TDGVTPATTPTVGITVSPENPTNTDLINLYESDQTVVTAIFTVDGPIPPEGLLVELAGPPRSIAEFDVNATNPRLPEAETVVEGVVVTGGSIVGTDEVAGSLIIRITEATATVAVPVFQDDEVEGREEFLFEIVDGEQYEVDPDADSIRVFIDDINGYREGDSANFVTPPPMYEGGLSDGEQANADFVDLLEGQALLDELQAGGYVVYIRHAQTERDFADQVTADVDDFSTQRVVSEFGVKQSLVIGEGFRNSEIPVAQVITSDYGRAVETAAIAFGEYEKNSDLNFLPVEDYTPEDIEEMRANVTPFLTAVPEDGTNTVIVAHDDLFEAGTGIYPDPQGIAYVIDPDGGQDGGLQVVANLLPEEWAALSDGVSG
ncbi:hypothetical protein, partial [Crocosphaera watsonii]|uniref:hypothetical protein n=1 Tax=Crocosphaera watsonii TaxID=263511 RepID=UPI000908240C